jgi:hypothetical protein
MMARITRGGFSIARFRFFVGSMVVFLGRHSSPIGFVFGGALLAVVMNQEIGMELLHVHEGLCRSWIRRRNGLFWYSRFSMTFIALGSAIIGSITEISESSRY